MDTYSLFDKKLENGSDWRIIGHQVNYNPKNLDGIYFALGIGDSCKRKTVTEMIFSFQKVSGKHFLNYLLKGVLISKTA